MILVLVYPIVLGLDRIETASFLRANGTFQYLTGLPNFPDPQTLRRILLHAPRGFWEHRSRLIFDLDSTVVTVFGYQDGAEVGYNPRYRGQRSYDPLLCIESNSCYLWDAELRASNAGPWAGRIELLDTCFANVPPDVRASCSSRCKVRLRPRLRRSRETGGRVRHRCPLDPGVPSRAPRFSWQVGAQAASQFGERLTRLQLSRPHAGMLRLISQSPGLSQQELGSQRVFPAVIVVLSAALSIIGQLISQADNRSCEKSSRQSLSDDFSIA
jgi:hypothetical protein